jgi:hypothetical protein
MHPSPLAEAPPFLGEGEVLPAGGSLWSAPPACRGLYLPFGEGEYRQTLSTGGKDGH